MKPETEAQYLSLARHFLAKLGAGDITPKRITDELKRVATQYRPDYWRRLRRGLELHQEQAGYPKSAERIRKTLNPVTADTKRRSEIPAKQKRVRNPSSKDEQALLQRLQERGDFQVLAAMRLAGILGVRPAEMPQLRVEGDTVLVTGVKKRTDRGADRLLTITDPEMLSTVEGAIAVLAGVDMRPIQDRLARHCQSLWPARKHRPSLYSWRHQMGSKLKSSGLNRRAGAYIMGHQSTESVNRYGNRSVKTGGPPLCVEPAEGADMSAVRENHTSQPKPPKSTPAPGAKSAGFRM